MTLEVRMTRDPVSVLLLTAAAIRALMIGTFPLLVIPIRMA